MKRTNTLRGQNADFLNDTGDDMYSLYALKCHDYGKTRYFTYQPITEFNTT